jgi:hypothetical protein
MKNQKGFSVVVILLALLLITAIVFTGYYVYDKQRSEKKEETTNVTNDELANATKKTSSPQPIDKTKSTVEAINAIIVKGDYQALSDYMTESVQLVVQSTDGSGPLPKKSAIASISNYLTKSEQSLGADLPWDFTGNPGFRDKVSKSSGIIKNYVPQGHIAISANNWVLAYRLDDNTKINSFYMSVSADIIE